MQEEWTFQQKLWIWGRTFCRAMVPLGLYVLMPALCLSVGYVLFHEDMTAQEFFFLWGKLLFGSGDDLDYPCALQACKGQKAQLF